MKLYHSSVRTQCSGRPAVEGFFRSSMSTVAWTIAEWFVNRAQSASPYQGQVPSVATSPAAPAWIAASPPPRSIKFLIAACCSSFRMLPDVLSQMSLALPLVALYEGSVWSVRWVEKRAAADRAAAAAAASAKPAE